nr:hypothetical protein [Sodalis glossinidius]
MCPSLAMTGLIAGAAADTCDNLHRRISMARVGEASEVASAMGVSGQR